MLHPVAWAEEGAAEEGLFGVVVVNPLCKEKLSCFSVSDLLHLRKLAGAALSSQPLSVPALAPAP